MGCSLTLWENLTSQTTTDHTVRLDRNRKLTKAVLLRLSAVSITTSSGLMMFWNVVLLQAGFPSASVMSDLPVAPIQIFSHLTLWLKSLFQSKQSWNSGKTIHDGSGEFYFVSVKPEVLFNDLQGKISVSVNGVWHSGCSNKKRSYSLTNRCFSGGMHNVLRQNTIWASQQHKQTLLVDVHWWCVNIQNDKTLFCGCWLRRSRSILDQFQTLLSTLVT